MTIPRQTLAKTLTYKTTEAPNTPNTRGKDLSVQRNSHVMEQISASIIAGVAGNQLTR